MSSYYKFRGYWVFWVAVVFFGLLGELRAATLYVTDRNEAIVRDFQYGAAAQVDLFGLGSSFKMVSAADPLGTHPDLWWSVGTRMYCNSATDTSTGACATDLIKSWSGGSRSIRLKFKETRSGLEKDLTVSALKTNGWSDPSCSGGFQGNLGINAIIPNMILCMDYNPAKTLDAAFFQMYLPASEINTLPVGGKWVARLELDVSPYHYRWVSTIELNINDANRHEIYFPEFGFAPPRFDMNLRPLPGAQGRTNLSGRRTVDMCLYDGYNSYSNGFMLSFTGEFALTKNGVGVTRAPAEETIPLRLNFATADGPWIGISPGQTLNINTNASPYRRVRIPTIQYPVVCRDTRLEFIVDDFTMAAKSSGDYSGVVRVTAILN